MLKQSDYKGLVESILLQLAIGDVHNAHSVANPIGFDAEPNITNHFDWESEQKLFTPNKNKPDLVLIVVGLLLYDHVDRQVLHTSSLCSDTREMFPLGRSDGN